MGDPHEKWTNLYKGIFVITTADIVYLLNELLRLDHGAITALINQRVLVLPSIDNHPTVTTHSVGTSDGENHGCLGILGILNGLSAIENKTIFAQYDKEGSLKGFDYYEQY